MTSRFSLREALLVSLVLVDRSFFFFALCLGTSVLLIAIQCYQMKGRDLTKKVLGFLFCLNVAIWRLKRSSPIFFQTWVESKQTDKLRPTRPPLDAGS